MSRNYSIPQLWKGSWGIELSVQVQYHLFYFLHRIWKDPGALCGFNPVPGATRLSSALPPSPNPGAGPEGALSKRLDKIFFFFSVQSSLCSAAEPGPSCRTAFVGTAQPLLNFLSVQSFFPVAPSCQHLVYTWFIWRKKKKIKTVAASKPFPLSEMRC